MNYDFGFWFKSPMATVRPSMIPSCLSVRTGDCRSNSRRRHRSYSMTRRNGDAGIRRYTSDASASEMPVASARVLMMSTVPDLTIDRLRLTSANLIHTVENQRCQSTKRWLDE